MANESVVPLAPVPPTPFKLAMREWFEAYLEYQSVRQEIDEITKRSHSLYNRRREIEKTLRTLMTDHTQVVEIQGRVFQLRRWGASNEFMDVTELPKVERA